MSWTYSCPYCQNVVNPDETVILIAGRSDVRILIGFHPQPGNYTIYLPPGCDLRAGDRWDFFCPVCQENLQSEEHENLCSLVVWQGAARRRILFSRVVGERATYITLDSNVEQKLGEHAGRYEQTLPRFRIEEGPDGPKIVT